MLCVRGSGRRRETGREGEREKESERGRGGEGERGRGRGGGSACERWSHVAWKMAHCETLSCAPHCQPVKGMHTQLAYLQHLLELNLAFDNGLTHYLQSMSTKVVYVCTLARTATLRLHDCWQTCSRPEPQPAGSAMQCVPAEPELS